MKLRHALVFLLILTTSHVYAAEYQVSGQHMLNKKLVTIPSSGSLASVVVFMSAKCPCSESHEPVIAKMASEFKAQKIDFVVVHSNQDETKESALKHFSASAKDHMFDVNIVSDPGAKIATKFKALKTPHAFIIQNDKIVFSGGVDDSSDAADAKKHFLRDALTELVAGKPITVSQARALGCRIQR